MINQIKAPFVPLKGNLPVIRNFLERQNLIFYFHGDTMHSYIAIENASKACIVVNHKINYKLKKYHSHIISGRVYIYLYGYIFLSRTNDKKE